MSIRWQCACGKSLKAPEASAGKRARCPACSQINTIPTPPPPEDATDSFDPFDLADEPAAHSPPPIAPAPAYEPAPTLSYLPLGSSSRRNWRDFTYLVLLLALLPLVVTTFNERRGGFVDQVRKSLAAHPEVKDKFRTVANSEEAGLDEIIDVFPGDKLEGAFLPRRTAAHWIFAAISAGLFFTLLMFLFAPGHAQPRSLLLTGLFTGTVGIILLLAFQYVASFSLATGFRIPHGRVGLLFLIVKFIGFSYQAADNPENGFLLSFLGFTFGVGLCEELCKAIPLLWLIRKRPEQASWRGACLWGLASGIGFGVAEGIMYSSRYYNGMQGGDIYIVRFASCVALHAIWSASVAIMIYMHADKIGAAPNTTALIGLGLLYAGVPMLLHGLYDTLLKKDHTLVALGVALASFAYLAGLIEWSMRKGDLDESNSTPAYTLPGRHAVR